MIYSPMIFRVARYCPSVSGLLSSTFFGSDLFLPLSKVEVASIPDPVISSRVFFRYPTEPLDTLELSLEYFLLILLEIKFSSCVLIFFLAFKF